MLNDEERAVINNKLQNALDTIRDNRLRLTEELNAKHQEMLPLYRELVEMGEFGWANSIALSFKQEIEKFIYNDWTSMREKPPSLLK